MSEQVFTESAKYAIDEFSKGNVQLELIYPLMLIRVIPHNAFAGSIYLPEQYRNNVIYEGIVLQTYKPRTVPFKNHSTSDDVKQNLMNLLYSTGSDGSLAYRQLFEKINAGFEHESSIVLESQYKVGDHIIFPYWAGRPIPGLHEEHYRALDDKNIFRPKTGQEDPQPIAVLNYEKPSVRDELRKSLSDFQYAAVETGLPDYHADLDTPLDQMLDKLLSTYHIVRKDMPARLESANPHIVK